MPTLFPPWLRNLPAQLSWLLPNQCALCGEPAGDPMCAHCERQFFNRPANRCPRCSIVLPHQTALVECPSCLRHPPAFDATLAAADYAPPIDQLVLALKFGDQLALAPAISRMMLRTIERTGLDHPDLLIAVPLGRQRLAERGFNQSLEIARILAKSLGVRLDKRCVQRRR